MILPFLFFPAPLSPLPFQVCKSEVSQLELPPTINRIDDVRCKYALVNQAARIQANRWACWAGSV